MIIVGQAGLSLLSVFDKSLTNQFEIAARPDRYVFILRQQRG